MQLRGNVVKSFTFSEEQDNPLDDTTTKRNQIVIPQADFIDYAYDRESRVLMVVSMVEAGYTSSVIDLHFFKVTDIIVWKNVI